MDGIDKREVLAEYLKKYRWAAVVLLIGIVMLMMPDSDDGNEAQVSVTDNSAQSHTLQQELEEILSELDGAGKVTVLLSTASGAQTYYQSNENRSAGQNTTDRKTETVIITASDRSQSGLIQRIDPPVYLGALVICQGGDKPAVKLAVVDAVSTVTGLSSDKISVWKMK